MSSETFSASGHVLRMLIDIFGIAEHQASDKSPWVPVWPWRMAPDDVVLDEEKKRVHV